MAKQKHEVRDPIHVFIRVYASERLAIDSAPIQRLRDIHQLALTYKVYPGATHRRFEHSLGVMELADRVFDVICSNQTAYSAAILPGQDLEQSRRILRLAALCHDIGHLPFSHAAEGLLPPGTKLLEYWQERVQSVEPCIGFITQHVGSMGVSQLERLTTALHVSWELGPTADADARARRVVELKPHVRLDDAARAVADIDRYSAEFGALAEGSLVEPSVAQMHGAS